MRTKTTLESPGAVHTAKAAVYILSVGGKNWTHHPKFIRKTTQTTYAVSQKGMGQEQLTLNTTTSN
jgi:hypothetical protein